MVDWWAGVSAAQATVHCGESEHRLRWESGDLHALDHADADAERTLAALGGQRCACVDLLDAWYRHAADLRVLALTSRGPADLLAAAEPAGPRHVAFGFAGPGPIRHQTAMRARWAGFSAGRRRLLPSFPDPDTELVDLLGLGGGLPDRLAATVAAAWSRRLVEPDEETSRALPRLEAALYGRAAAALRVWLGIPAQAVDLDMLDGSQQPRLSLRDGAIKAELPFSWLVDVWAKGLAVVAGRFCLAAAQAGGRLRLSTVSPDLGQVRLVTLDLPADE